MMTIINQQRLSSLAQQIGAVLASITCSRKFLAAAAAAASLSRFRYPCSVQQKNLQIAGGGGKSHPFWG
jgi:hypothetical protein